MTCAHAEIVEGRCRECGAELATWFESAADLLAEGDPGATPFLVSELLVDRSLAAIVGSPKRGKTWVLLELALAVATGEPAFGRFAVPEPGPVLLVLEESGRAALHRRLDKLVRGRALEPGRLRALYIAANRRVRLDDEAWQAQLRAARPPKGSWRLVAFDPLARVKGATTDENSQRELGPVLDFLRDLRDEHGATVAHVHHTPHDGTRQRGTSDLEAWWESKLTLAQTGEQRTLQAEHREAEAAGPYPFSFGYDEATGTFRPRVLQEELVEWLRAYLSEHPDASQNAVYDAARDAGHGKRRQAVLELVKAIREGGSQTGNHPGTTTPELEGEGGSPAPPYRGPGTTRPAPVTGVVPAPGTTGSEHVTENGVPPIGDAGYLEHLYAALVAGVITEDEWQQGSRAHRLVVARTRERS
jgi:hypothetical protein